MGGGSFKYIIPSIVVLILIGAIVIGYFKPKQLLGNAYSITDLKNNFDNIQIGDEVNYEINGYSDWQVIGKNEYDGIIQVTSKTNTEDLTLEPNQTKEYYEQKFQETANKYTDNNYAISARTVNSSDLDYFNYDNNFWLNNISDTNITTSQSSWQYDQSNVEPNYKMYVIPYVEKYFENYNEYNVGDIVEYSNNGVNRWVVAEVREWNSSLILIQEAPIELVIESADDNINEKASQIIQSFNNHLDGYGNYVSSFGTNNLPNLISNFLNQHMEKIWFYDWECYDKVNDTIRFACGGNQLYYENGEFGRQSGTIYTEQGPRTLGYRPVITLKVKEELQDKDKKEISSKLKVGDNVKYEAKGYKNWKVLSVDNDLNTVDIISGGIVKNITLSGKEDWDNYEDIIQREVDQYKNGDKAKKVTTVTSKDLKTLKEIDKSILSRYWILNKNTYKRDQHDDSGGHADTINYSIGSIYLYKYDNYEMKIDNITIYTGVSGEGETYDRYKQAEEESFSYTAGLRPVITLKLDSVEKLPEKETKKIETSTSKQEKVYLKEQESKNKNYKGPKTVDDTSSKGTKKDNNINNNSNKNKDKNVTDKQKEKIIEKTVYKDRPFYKYGFILFLTISIIELIIIIILSKKLKK